MNEEEKEWLKEVQVIEGNDEQILLQYMDEAMSVAFQEQKNSSVVITIASSIINFVGRCRRFATNDKT